MTSPSPIASAEAAVKSAATAEVSAAESKVKAFAVKYWPIAAGIVIALSRFL